MKSNTLPHTRAIEAVCESTVWRQYIFCACVRVCVREFLFLIPLNRT